ncbi:YqcC family protein [Endozoicomonas sp.]|nr:YqcC family protein [Endozoicomonas sp.]
MKNDVLALLDAVEKELNTLSLWETMSPSIEALSSQTPFCMDTLKMTQWLQWIFIPRVRAILDQGAALPVGANMKPYAEEAFIVDGTDATRLLELIGQFDQLMS